MMHITEPTIVFANMLNSESGMIAFAGESMYRLAKGIENPDLRRSNYYDSTLFSVYNLNPGLSLH